MEGLGWGGVGWGGHSSKALNWMRRKMFLHGLNHVFYLTEKYCSVLLLYWLSIDVSFMVFFLSFKVKYRSVLFSRNVKISQFDTHWQGTASLKMFNWARDLRKEFKLADAPSVFFIFDSNARGTAVGSRLRRRRCLLQGILSWRRRRRKLQSDGLFSFWPALGRSILTLCRYWPDSFENVDQTVIKKHHE